MMVIYEDSQQAEDGMNEMYRKGYAAQQIEVVIVPTLGGRTLVIYKRVWWARLLGL